MAERPGVAALAGSSIDFVFKNIRILFEQVKIIFPLLLLMEVISGAAEGQGFKWIPAVTLIPSIYLYACFALSWHRSSLAGPSAAHAVNPFSVPKEDMGFIGLFFAVTFLPLLAGLLVGGLIGGAAVIDNTAVMIAAVVIALPVSVYGFIQFIRYSFKLPARSLGVPLTFKEAKQASRGMVSKAFLAGVMVLSGGWIVFFIGALVMALTVGMITAGSEPGLVGEIFMTILFGAPILAGTMILTAINITILSKCYQWGIQNNAPDAV